MRNSQKSFCLDKKDISILCLGCFGMLKLFNPHAAVAADFTGSLRSVQITGSNASNRPPTAVIKYTNNGNAFTFDASASTDSDGVITQYKWDFGDGTIGTGVSVQHTFIKIGDFPATLTVIDNLGSLALAQTITSTAQGIKFYWGLEKLPGANTITSDYGDVQIARYKNDGVLLPGVTGNSLQQNGLWQSYTLPMTTLPTTSGKIKLFAKHTNAPSTSDGQLRYFFKAGKEGVANSIYAYTYKGNLYFVIYDANAVLHRVYKSTDYWSQDTWYQYEFVWNSDVGYLKIFRDGVKLAETSQTPWIGAPPSWGTQLLSIGYDYEIGGIDEFYIYDNPGN